MDGVVTPRRRPAHLIRALSRAGRQTNNGPGEFAEAGLGTRGTTAERLESYEDVPWFWPEHGAVGA